MRLIRSLIQPLHPMSLAAVLCCPLTTFADTALPPLTVAGVNAELDQSGVQLRVPVDPLLASDLPSLLATLPGVQVRRSGGLGAYSEASLRGSNGRQVRILLDGQPLDGGGGEATSLALISPLMLHDVTVHKGRVPVDLAGGLAGSIHLRTPEVLRAPLLGSVSLGSFGERQAHAAAQLATDVQLAAGLQQADNDFKYRNAFKPFDPTDPDRRRRERRLNADTAQRYALLSLRAPLRVQAHVIDDAQSLPTRLNLPDQTAQLDTRAYGLSIAGDTSARWHHRLSTRWLDERFRDRDSQIGLGAQDSRSRTFGIDGQSRFNFANGSLAVLDAGHTRYRAEDRIGDVPTQDAERLQLGGAAEAFGDLGAWRANASLGVQWSEDRADGQQEDHWQWAPAVGLTRRLGPCIAAGNLGSRERLATFLSATVTADCFAATPRCVRSAPTMLTLVPAAHRLEARGASMRRCSARTCVMPSAPPSTRRVWAARSTPSVPKSTVSSGVAPPGSVAGRGRSAALFRAPKTAAAPARRAANNCPGATPNRSTHGLRPSSGPCAGSTPLALNTASFTTAQTC